MINDKKVVLMLTTFKVGGIMMRMVHIAYARTLIDYAQCKNDDV
jgi:hypothetical protein